jgi:AcrR family transcriptional regulator
LRNDQRILEAAARVLADDPRATIQRIADEAGVVRLTVYRRYANRDALRRAIYEAAAEEASLRAGVRPELLAQAVVGTLRIASRFGGSSGVDGVDLGAEVADLVLNGAATGRAAG